MFFMFFFFFFSSRRRHTRSLRDWSSDVCSSDLELELSVPTAAAASLAAVSATAVARLALVFDRADVEGRVDVPDRLLRLRHRAVLSDVQSDVSAHEGHVAVVDQER